MLVLNSLYQYIAAITHNPLTADEKHRIAEGCRLKHLKKKQFTLRAGERCRQLLFIARGAMRMFGVDQKGKQHTVYLALEGTWICDHESLNAQTPSRYCIEALEDCEVIQIQAENLFVLKATVASFRKMMNLHDQHHIIHTQKRVQVTLNLSAEERYRHLLQSNPMFVSRFSQNILASYLGITFETLSRIRKQLALKL